MERGRRVLKRAIPIDSFLEDLEDQRSDAREPVNATSFDWGRIVSEGRAARAAADGGRWRIGHLALLVERRYASGALQRFAEEIGESYATVRRFRWVAKAYDPDIRLRFPGLSFSHFQAVAGHPDRLTWLHRAARGGWSVDRLTRQAQADDADPATKGPSADLAAMRATIERLRRSMAPAAELDDAAIARAGREWLSDALDDLSREIGRLKERIGHAANASEHGRPLKVARGGGRRTRRPRTPAALKARAVGR